MSTLNTDCIYLILEQLNIKLFYMYTCKYVKGLTNTKIHYKKVVSMKYIRDTLQKCHYSIGKLRYYYEYQNKYYYDEDISVPTKICHWGTNYIRNGMVFGHFYHHTMEIKPSEEMIKEYKAFEEKMIKKYYN